MTGREGATNRGGLRGKSHEPRVLVSGWKDGRWSAAGKTLDESLCTGVQSWVYAFDGDYVGHRELTRRDLDRCDIVIVNSNRPLLPLLRLAADRPRSVRWVTLIEGAAEDYWVPQEHLRALLDLSDLVDVINRHSLPLFRLLTTSKVEHIGIPYPVDGVHRLMTPVAGRKRRIFLCTQLLRRWNDQLAAGQMGLPYYGHEARRSREQGLRRLSAIVKTRSFAGDDEENIKRARALYDDSALGIITFTKDFRRYVGETGDAYFWVNLESRYTWARYVLDAAALRMPIVTTAATCHGETFFPETTVAHAMDFERAIGIGRRLAADRDFYEHVARYPEGRMESLKAEPMKRALLGALGLL